MTEIVASVSLSKQSSGEKCFKEDIKQNADVICFQKLSSRYYLNNNTLNTFNYHVDEGVLSDNILEISIWHSMRHILRLM